ncbi:MAG: hybrid sensor histidine kinase/response regulator [Solirubrobacteraceae bacterium]
MTAIVAAGIAMAAIIGLTVNAGGRRDAQIQLANVAATINELQNLPWKLASSSDVNPAQITASIAGGESQVLAELARLRRDKSILELAEVERLATANFRWLSAELSLLTRQQINSASRLEAARFRSQDMLLAAIGRAQNAYENQAVGAEIDAVAGTAVIIVALLGGFAFFFYRAHRARRAAETLAARLRESEAHLAEAQRVAGVGSWEWHAVDGMVRSSAEHARLHGWPAVDSVRMPDEVLALVTDPDERAELEAAMVKAFQTRSTVGVEYRMSLPDGVRLIHLDATTLRGADGSAIGLLGTCQDVTDRFRRAEAERANEAKNAFISRMSHELRTPLNAILGFGQLMETADLDERQRVNATRIVGAGRHLLGLINEILDISRIESGKLRLSPEPVDAGPAISEAAELLAPLAAGRRIAIEVPPSSEQIWVKADIQRLRQVLLNLISNAIKYNRDGGGVTVTTAAGAGRIRITVTDDGPGIAPELMDRLFEPFERLGAEQSGIEGTGLGLALSKGMAEAMGGGIAADSHLGRGTSMTLELRAAETPGTPVVRPAQRVLAEDGSDRVISVLYIEDNPSNLVLVEQVLATRPGVRVITARSGTGGTRLARERRPDLVLLDLHLPDLDGSAVLARLKSQPDTAAIPIVILSADGDPEQRARLIAQGASDYLTKPLDIQCLLRLVDMTVDTPLEVRAA